MRIPASSTKPIVGRGEGPGPDPLPPIDYRTTRVGDLWRTASSSHVRLVSGGIPMTIRASSSGVSYSVGEAPSRYRTLPESQCAGLLDTLQRTLPTRTSREQSAACQALISSLEAQLSRGKGPGPDPLPPIDYRTTRVGDLWRTATGSHVRLVSEGLPMTIRASSSGVSYSVGEAPSRYRTLPESHSAGLREVLNRKLRTQISSEQRLVCRSLLSALKAQDPGPAGPSSL